MECILKTITNNNGENIIEKNNTIKHNLDEINKMKGMGEEG
jgi:hypothetical protein